MLTTKDTPKSHEKTFIIKDIPPSLSPSTIFTILERYQPSNFRCDKHTHSYDVYFECMDSSVLHVDLFAGLVIQKYKDIKYHEPQTIIDTHQKRIQDTHKQKRIKKPILELELKDTDLQNQLLLGYAQLLAFLYLWSSTTFGRLFNFVFGFLCLFFKGLLSMEDLVLDRLDGMAVLSYYKGYRGIVEKVLDTTKDLIDQHQHIDEDPDSYVE